jgi:hypothetical protein
MFFKKPKPNPIFEMLKKNPGHMYVCPTFIAVALNEDRVLAVTGDFTNITEEEANLRLQNAITKML